MCSTRSQDRGSCEGPFDRHRETDETRLMVLWYLIVIVIRVPGLMLPLLQTSRYYGEQHKARHESKGGRCGCYFESETCTTLWTSRIVVERVTVTLYVGHIAISAVGMLTHVWSTASRMVRPRGWQWPAIVHRPKHRWWQLWWWTSVQVVTMHLQLFSICKLSVLRTSIENTNLLISFHECERNPFWTL